MFDQAYGDATTIGPSGSSSGSRNKLFVFIGASYTLNLNTTGVNTLQLAVGDVTGDSDDDLIVMNDTYVSVITAFIGMARGLLSRGYSVRSLAPDFPRISGFGGSLALND
jgi:hypothetical protein